MGKKVKPLKLKRTKQGHASLTQKDEGKEVKVKKRPK